jgi:hypothetical protein
MNVRLWERRAGSRSRRLAVLVAVACVLALAGPAQAQDPAGTYGARPAAGRGDRADATFELSVPAGSARTDAVEVLNFVDTPTTFELYAAATVTTNTGSLAPAGREAEINGAAAWISLEQER